MLRDRRVMPIVIVVSFSTSTPSYATTDGIEGVLVLIDMDHEKPVHISVTPAALSRRDGEDVDVRPNLKLEHELDELDVICFIFI